MKLTIEQTEAQLSAIRGLMAHPGWKVLCELHAVGVQNLTDQVLDPKLDDEIATRLRHARGVVVELSPESILKTREAKLAAALKIAADEAQKP